MRASLLPNDTWWEQVRPASRASHRAQCWADMSTSRGEPGRWGRGARERQAGARLSLIQLQGVAMTPSPVDTLCASQANGLSPCSAAPFLSHRQAPSPLHTQPHTLPHTHTYSHTNTHNLPRYSNTPHTPSLTLTYSSHTLIHHSHTPHILHTHTYTLFTPSHTQIHKLLTHTYTLTHSSHTHTHTLLIPSHTHSHTVLTCTHTHTHTQTQAQSLQGHRHRKHGDPGAVLTHQARGACGNSPESQLGSVAGTCTHWEPLEP